MPSSMDLAVSINPKRFAVHRRRRRFDAPVNVKALPLPICKVIAQFAQAGESDLPASVLVMIPPSVHSGLPFSTGAGLLQCESCGWMEEQTELLFALSRQIGANVARLRLANTRLAGCVRIEGVIPYPVRA